MAGPNDKIETMTRMRQAGWAGMAALLALGFAVAGPVTGVAAGAEPIDTTNAPRAQASNGVVVVMPEIALLDCDGMQAVLRRIDQSNYRGTDTIPEGHPDWPIFEYEDRLTGQYYFSCTLGENQLEDPGAAFSFGFDSQ
jgi:hypothetical protein